MKLRDVDEDLEEFKYTVNTQAVAELTNYRGLHDWGEVRYIGIRSPFFFDILTRQCGNSRATMQQVWEHFPSQVLAWYIPRYLGMRVSFCWVCGANHVPSATDGAVSLMTLTFP